MNKTLSDILSQLPKARQSRIDERYRAMKDQIEGLRELRQLTGKAQVDIAAALKIKQPSISKIEKQTDMYLSTLRDYVEAAGGKLELVVRLPKRRAIRLTSIGTARHERTIGTNETRTAKRKIRPSSAA